MRNPLLRHQPSDYAAVRMELENENKKFPSAFAIAVGVAVGFGLTTLSGIAPSSLYSHASTSVGNAVHPQYRFTAAAQTHISATRAAQAPVRSQIIQTPMPTQVPSAWGSVTAFCSGCLLAVAGLAMTLRVQPKPTPLDLGSFNAVGISGIQEETEVPPVFGSNPDPNSLHRRMEAMLRKGQLKVCSAIEECDGKAKFRADAWTLPNGNGGGVSRVLADGKVWEKAGVNLSVIRGQMPQEALPAATEKAAVYLKNMGLKPGEPVPFFVASLSCVMHPRNPHCPTMHFNYRYFELDKDNWWFAGGTDITPAYLDEDDMKYFHGTYKKVCDNHDKDFYPQFKKRADEYFLIKHRGETRGLGGIFFDDLNDRDPDTLFKFAEECLDNVVTAYVPIIEKHKNDSFTEEQKRWQLLRRGRYAEFNLVYDRGTIFGLRAGGRIESILMTIPEVARWEYNHKPAPGSEEEKIMKLFKEPRDWV